MLRARSTDFPFTKQEYLPLLSKNRIRILCASFTSYLPTKHKISFWRLSEMRWEKPSYKDLRFGFEVTMYIYNR